MSADRIKQLKEFKEDFFPVLEVETAKSNITNGIAASFYGFSSVGETVHNCKYGKAGEFPEFLASLTVKAFRHAFGDKKYDLLMFVPSTTSGDLVKNFTVKLGRALRKPVSEGIVKTRKTEPQKIFKTGILKSDNVKNAFGLKDESEVRGKSILLIDDIFDSGATIKELGRMLTRHGAEVISPLVIAKTIGHD